MAAFINPESAVRVLGTMKRTQDPLEDAGAFYYKYLKEWHLECAKPIPGTDNGISSTRDGIDRLLDMDEPGLRRLVDEHFERHIQFPGKGKGDVK
ncbi:hypothetical protein QBC46DRAFT_435019 [Diplogelasinospora grovesii]|uniref:Uncharacterized protein n=1 Tax=Diplogelasinospora grovesii TaxID=303347 RepID=A0AAN6N9K3_9PEZI|nr:hypothetical protein QBC46DRAFT_435019 [Diplogelasinospora grovesii]